MEHGTLNKASCCLRFIKAIFPLLLYDGEPSVPNEIVSQLPSFHLFIHRVPTKLLNGIVSHGENYRWLQLLFLDILLTSFPLGGAGFPADAMPPLVPIGLVADVALKCHIIFRFFSRTLSGSRSRRKPGKALELSS